MACGTSTKRENNGLPRNKTDRVFFFFFQNTSCDVIYIYIVCCYRRVKTFFFVLFIVSFLYSNEVGAGSRWRISGHGAGDSGSSTCNNNRKMVVTCNVTCNKYIHYCVIIRWRRRRWWRRERERKRGTKCFISAWRRVYISMLLAKTRHCVLRHDLNSVGGGERRRQQSLAARSPVPAVGNSCSQSSGVFSSRSLGFLFQ